MKNGIEIKGKIIGAGRPLICIPVMKASEEEILAEVKRLTEISAEMIEWRVDAFEHAKDLNAIRQVLAKLKPLIENTPFVFTFRTKAQGGLLSLSQEEIYDIHQIGAESKVVDFVDVEVLGTEHVGREIKALQAMGARVIGSHHDFNETPEYSVLEMLLERIHESGADIVKLAVMPKEAEDVFSLMEVTNQFHKDYPNRPIVTMSMGRLGAISRISGELTGSCITFGNAGEVSAPGQIGLDQLTKILDILTLSEN